MDPNKTTERMDPSRDTAGKAVGEETGSERKCRYKLQNDYSHHFFHPSTFVCLFGFFVCLVLQACTVEVKVIPVCCVGLLVC